MLDKLAIAGFKSIKNAEIKLAPRITILIGANGSGKSSFFQALLLLKQSSGNGNLNTNGPYLRSIDENAHIHNHTPKLPVTISFSGSRNLPILGKTSYSNTSSFIGTKIADTSMQVTANGFKLDSKNGSQSHIVSGLEFRFEYSRSIPSSWQAKPATKEAESSPLFQDGILLRAGQLPHIELFLMQYVPPFRAFIDPSDSLAETAPKQLLRPYDFVNALILSRKDLVPKVSNWLEAVTGVRIDPELKENKNVAVETVANGFSVNLLADGSGTNQLVMFLTTLALTKPESVALIDEPELHLHPQAQYKLVRNVLVPASKSGQLILSTQSEHILYAFLGAVMRGELAPDDLIIWSIAKDAHHSTTAHQLSIGPGGAIAGNIPGFFEATMDGLDDIIEGLKKQQE